MTRIIAKSECDVNYLRYRTVQYPVYTQQYDWILYCMYCTYRTCVTCVCTRSDHSIDTHSSDCSDGKIVHTFRDV